MSANPKLRSKSGFVVALAAAALAAVLGLRGSGKRPRPRTRPSRHKRARSPLSSRPCCRPVSPRSSNRGRATSTG